jgi:hypothetical protein
MRSNRTIFSDALANGIEATIVLSMALAAGHITKAQRPRIEHYTDQYGEWARITVAGIEKEMIHA